MDKIDIWIKSRVEFRANKMMVINVEPLWEVSKNSVFPMLSFFFRVSSGSIQVYVPVLVVVLQ